ncbi:MAG: extracellular solute-binding protein [Ignavibacteriales bacterium]|nr:extracellular solute-binding protein [Ignavibacteriales bacterium]
MNAEKIFYIILSTILVTVFILFTFVFSPGEFNTSRTSKQKTIYFVDHISAAHQKVIDLFNERNKGSIKVETINLSFDKFSTNERKELLARYLRSKNNRIDVFAVDQIWVPRFVKWGKPLDAFIDSTEKANLFSDALKTCINKNSLVAVPLYIDIAVMFYRDDLINKLPDYPMIRKKLNASITWEDFINLNSRVNKNGKPFFIFQADDYEGLICAFTELMANQNNPIIDANGKVFIDSPEGKKSLQLLVDLVNKYKAAPEEVTSLKENESYRLFIKDNAHFLRGWTSMLGDETIQIPDDVKENVKMIPVPHFTGSNTASVYGGWNLMVSNYSEKIPEVMKFVKFLLSVESQKIMYEERGYLPINNKLYSDSNYVKLHPELRFLKQVLQTGVHRPFLQNYTSVSDILSYYIKRAIKNEISVDEALNEATRKINEKAILVK